MQKVKEAQELRLMILMRRSPALRALGCEATLGLTGSVCLTCHETALGAWWYEDGQFHFARSTQYRPEKSTRSRNQIIHQSIEMAIAHLGKTPVHRRR